MDRSQDTAAVPPAADRKLRQERSFLHYAILFYGVGLLFALVIGLVWLASDVLLLAFSCVLGAILLHDVSRRLERRFGFGRTVSLAIVVAALLSALGLTAWLAAPEIARQLGDLASAIPQALDRLRNEAARHPLLRDAIAGLPPTEQLMTRLTRYLSQVGLVFTGVIGAVGNTLIILFVAIYFAAQPRLYIDGALVLVPRRKRERMREVVSELGRTLGQWLTAKALTMLIVGVATAAGLALLGMPLALVLGLLAGLLDFIPYLGPIVAGVPAVLIAFAESPALALQVAALFLGVQLVEGYLLMPIVERRAVSLPPALTIMMQVLLGSLFGLGGVALATPLTVVVAVLVTMLYVQDGLGEAVSTPGEQNGQDQRDG